MRSLPRDAVQHTIEKHKKWLMKDVVGKRLTLKDAYWDRFAIKRNKDDPQKSVGSWLLRRSSL